jgi:hypothetical protein
MSIGLIGVALAAFVATVAAVVVFIACLAGMGWVDGAGSAVGRLESIVGVVCYLGMLLSCPAACLFATMALWVIGGL